MDYELIVIGGGPGGYTAAVAAARQGHHVALIEQGRLGGVCLQRGCIPTKTLLASVHKYQELSNLTEFGISAQDFSFDFAKIMHRKRQVVEQLEKGIQQLVKNNKIELLHGQASFCASHSLKITLADGAVQTISAPKIIIATGAEPVILPVPGHDLAGVVTSDDLLDCKQVPKSLLVVGAGAVGLEFASIYNAFGTKVTIIEMLPQILAGMEPDLAKRLLVPLKKQGMTIMTEAKLTEITAAPDGALTASFTDKKGLGQTIAVEKILFAAGRRPALAALKLEEAGIACTKKGIVVDARLATNIPGIFAIGDVTGQHMLAHAAGAAATTAVHNIFWPDDQQTMDYHAVPACVFTMPPAAGVGLSEQDALAKGRQIKVGKAPFAANGKAVSAGSADGFIKLVVDSATDEILGVHILGLHADDLIAEACLIVGNRLTTASLRQTIHPHPTLCEIFTACLETLKCKS